MQALKRCGRARKALSVSPAERGSLNARAPVLLSAMISDRATRPFCKSRRTSTVSATTTPMPVSSKDAAVVSMMAITSLRLIGMSRNLGICETAQTTSKTVQLTPKTAQITLKSDTSRSFLLLAGFCDAQQFGTEFQSRIFGRGLIGSKAHAAILNHKGDHAAVAHERIPLTHGQNTRSQAGKDSEGLFSGLAHEKHLAGL